MYSFLNVGGHRKEIPVPQHYQGWNHLLLDIDKSNNPDIHCDARNLTGLDPDRFDAIYCSHTLEHFYRHDVPKVLSGFKHIVKKDGFVEIAVPDILALMKVVVRHNLDMEQVLYQAPIGPVKVCDVIYGYGPQIEQSGEDFFAHKHGFSPTSLDTYLKNAGFRYVFCKTGNLEIQVLVFLSKHSQKWLNLLNLALPS